MTLHDEQKGELIDRVLHEKNRRAWNAWSGQTLSAEERAAAAKSSKIDVAELEAWEDLSEEIKARFAAEYRRRNPEVGTVPDLPKATRLIDMSSTYFANTLVLDGFVFASEASFILANFMRTARFASATFMSATLFDSATFKLDALFDTTTFRRDVLFHSATFASDAMFEAATFVQAVWFAFVTFRQSAEFDYTTFTQDAVFVEATFSSNASFDSATFQQSASFSSATFKQDAWFASVTFTQDADFCAATFAQNAQFKSASFSGFAYFTGTRFGSSTEEPCIPDFSDCLFEKPTSFRQALFCDGYPDFSGAVLHDKTSFTARMKPTPNEIKRDKDLKGRTFWPQKTQQDPVSARESCATIRHVLTQQGLPEDAHFFFRREMHFAGLPSEDCAGLSSEGRSKERSFTERLPYLLFGWLSDFGYSIQRPLVWLLCLWAFGGAAFWGYLASCCVPAPPGVVERPMGTAMALSFSNLFPLFGFGRGALGEILDEMPPVLQVLSGAQTVLSLPLLFFLGLALRQRFRLR
ncbi:pentapeptide repeat-containing protein [Tritonibacter scottomollicae]|nr:pentapeptide repeat-containing protein [Tritonibacter scottomollicae]